MPSPMHYQRKRFRRNYESDRLIDELGLARKNIIVDPNCLFRVVSENIFRTQRLHDKVRSQCVGFMGSNRERFNSLVDGSFEDYVKELSRHETFGGFTEISVMSHLYRKDFLIISNNDATKTEICNNYGEFIYLLFHKDAQHFDALFKKEYLNQEGFCQSITYEILYESVFNMSHIINAVDKMLHNSERDKNVCSKNLRVNIRELGSKANEDPKEKENSNKLPEDNAVDSGEHFTNNNQKIDALQQFENGSVPFPYTIARALDPNIYKNVELDAWKESFIEKSSLDSFVMRVGLKCLCKLLPDDDMLYQCHIQEIDHQNGTSVVFVEDIGEKRTLALDLLEHMPDVEAVSRENYYDRGFLTMNQILNHLRNLKVNNVQKYRNKTKRNGGSFGRDIKNKDYHSGNTLLNNPNFHKYGNRSNHLEGLGDQNNNRNAEEGPRRSSVDLNVNHNSSEYLDAYTQINNDNFKPYQVEMIAMPIIVNPESCDNSSREGSTRSNSLQDGSTSTLHYSVMLPGMDQNTPTYANPPPSPGTNSSTINTATSTIILTGSPNGGSPYTSGPVFFMPPGQHQSTMNSVSPMMPLPRFCPQPPSLPPTVSGLPQRSVVLNGSDLPYHDVATLRYFFNLGIDWMSFSLGWGSAPSPLLPPPQTPRSPNAPHPNLHTPFRHPPPNSLNRPSMLSQPHTYPHQQRLSPDELAMEMQLGLNIDDSTESTTPDPKKPPNGKSIGNHLQKNGSNNSNGTSRGGRSFVYSSRYRGRNDGPQDKNNNKNNQNKGYGNPNNGAIFHKGARISRNGDHQQVDVLNSSRDGRDENYPDETFSSPTERPSSLQYVPDMSFISYPPPPLYRYPYYPSENDGSTAPPPYPPHYVPYAHEDVSSQADPPYSSPVSPLHAQPQYVNLSYVPLHQQMFFPPQPPPAYSAYYPPQFASSPPDSEGHSK